MTQQQHLCTMVVGEPRSPHAQFWVGDWVRYVVRDEPDCPESIGLITGFRLGGEPPVLVVDLGDALSVHADRVRGHASGDPVERCRAIRDWILRHDPEFEEDPMSWHLRERYAAIESASVPAPLRLRWDDVGTT